MPARAEYAVRMGSVGVSLCYAAFVQCYAAFVYSVLCSASQDMKIGLTGLASKIGVYSHERWVQEEGVQLSNSAFMTCCCHHRHPRQEKGRRFHDGG